MFNYLVNQKHRLHMLIILYALYLETYGRLNINYFPWFFEISRYLIFSMILEILNDFSNFRKQNEQLQRVSTDVTINRYHILAY